MGNPMLEKLRGMTKTQDVSKSASDAEEPEAKATESPAEPAAEPDAPAKSAKKNTKKISPLERMKAGMNKGKKNAKPAKAKGAAGKLSQAADESTESVEPAAEAGINPPEKKKSRRKPVVSAKEKGESDQTDKTAKPAKKKTGVKSAAKDTASDSPDVETGPSLLLIGCYPVQGGAEPAQLHELLEDVKEVVCGANGLAHWGFLKYTADAALAQALDAKLTEEGVPSLLFAEPFSAETRAVEQVLLKHYEIVIRGIR